MQYSPNYNLNLPEEDEFYGVNIFNENFIKIEEELKKNGERKVTDDDGTHGIRYKDEKLQVQDTDGNWTDASVMADDALSETSDNPVQNKVITTEINTLKKSVSDGKSIVANAITGQGVATAADAAFATMAANIGTVGTNKYNAGVNAAKVGTAGAGDVLAGKTFTNASNVGATGTMPNRSSAIQTAIIDTSDKNKSIFRTNGTNVEVIPAVGYWGTWDWSKEKILIPASSLGITANKILKGNTICGVAGTAEGGGQIICNYTVNGAPNEVITVSGSGITTDKVSNKVTLNSSGTGSVLVGGNKDTAISFTGSISGYTRQSLLFNSSETVNVYPDGNLYWYGRNAASWNSFYFIREDRIDIPEFNYNTNSLCVKFKGKASGGFSIIRTIDLSNFSKLNVKINVSQTASEAEQVYPYICITDKYLSGKVEGSDGSRIAGNFINNSGITTLDISSITGSHYVSLLIADSFRSDNKVFTSEAFAVWTE